MLQLIWKKYCIQLINKIENKNIIWYNYVEWGGEALTIIVTILETLCILIIYNIIINKNILNNINKYIIISIVASLIIKPIIDIPNLNGGILIFVILFLLAVIISKIDKRSEINVFCELCISQLMLMLIQFIATIPIYLILGNNWNNNLIFTFNMFIILALILGVSKVLQKFNIKFALVIDKYIQINIVIINSILFVFIIKLVVRSFEVNFNIMTQIVTIVTTSMLVNFFYFINMIKKSRKNKKEEIEKNIDPLIDDLINKMRAREHEYKNHLNMLYCMVQVCNEGELKEKVKEYVGNITSNEDELSKIARLDNTIIKAIIFSKVKLAESYEVQFKYNIESDLEKISLDNSELTVLLSNLLNNSIESSGLCKEKYVELDIYEEDDEYIIYIKNSVEDIDKELVKKMFKEGYSTKGNNRGYGLFNIKNILDKHKGKIYSNIEDGYIEFNIEIPIERYK